MENHRIQPLNVGFEKIVFDVCLLRITIYMLTIHRPRRRHRHSKPQSSKTQSTVF